MATVNKDFKLKNGLIVEGSTATVAGYDILTKATDDQNYIISLIGGSATSDATPDTVVLRDGNAGFSAVNVSVDSLTLDGSDLQGLLNSADQAAQGYASDAQSAAETFATNADSALYTTVTGDIATAKSEAGVIAQGYADSAESAANTYTDNAISGEVSDRNNAINQAINTEVTNRNDAIDSAITNLNLSGTYDALGAADQALTDAKAYTDQEVSALVDGAPALLDTLNELAAALQDNPDVIQNIQDVAAGKQDSLTAGEGIYIDGDNIITGRQQSGGGLKFVFNEAAIDRSTVDSWYDASGAANTAYNNATSYADDLASNYDSAGSAYQAEQNANSYTDNAVSGVNNTINNLTTDDVAEGDNLYYTAYRAKAEAADLLANATKTNIVITKDVNDNLTITAENGVADSTTDDLVEGDNNLYFTDSRAVSALEAVTPNFPAIEIDAVAKQVAASASVPTAGTNSAITWATADYRSAEFLVKIASGSHTDVSKVILTLDSSDNIAITEYAMVGTNGSLGSVTADVNGADARLRVTTANNNSTVTVMGTLLV